MRKAKKQSEAVLVFAACGIAGAEVAVTLSILTNWTAFLELEEAFCDQVAFEMSTYGSAFLGAISGNNTGIDNTAVGTLELQANTPATPTLQSVSGHSKATRVATRPAVTSPLYNSTGSNNTANGDSALKSNTTRSANTSVLMRSTRTQLARTTRPAVIGALENNTAGIANTAAGGGTRRGPLSLALCPDCATTRDFFKSVSLCNRETLVVS